MKFHLFYALGWNHCCSYRFLGPKWVKNAYRALEIKKTNDFTKTHFFVIIENSWFFAKPPRFRPAGGRNPCIPTQGYGLGRGNGGNSHNFTENWDFSEKSGNSRNFVKFTKMRKSAHFRPELRMSPRQSDYHRYFRWIQPETRFGRKYWFFDEFHNFWCN